MSVSIMPGRDDVHRDAARRHLARQRLGEPDQPGLRRGVVGLPGVAHLADHRADGDDAAAALLQHRPHRRLRQREGRGQVGRDHRVPVVALHPHQQLIAGDAGVADDDVEPAVPLDDRRRQLLERRRVGDVDADAPRRARRSSAIAATVSGGVVAARRGHHDRALRRRAARAIARPMPRDAPVTSATFPVQIEHAETQRLDRRPRSSGRAEAGDRRRRGGSCAPGRSRPCPDPPQHTL